MVAQLVSPLSRSYTFGCSIGTWPSLDEADVAEAVGAVAHRSSISLSRYGLAAVSG